MTHYPPSEDLLQEAFSKGFEQVRRRCVTAESERDAAVAENARLLARIAAVEAENESLRRINDASEWRPRLVELRAEARAEGWPDAALAASPTPNNR